MFGRREIDPGIAQAEQEERVAAEAIKAADDEFSPVTPRRQ